MKSKSSEVEIIWIRLLKGVMRAKSQISISTNAKILIKPMIFIYDNDMLCSLIKSIPSGAG